MHESWKCDIAFMFSPYWSLVLFQISTEHLCCTLCQVRMSMLLLGHPALHSPKTSSAVFIKWSHLITARKIVTVTQCPNAWFWKHNRSESASDNGHRLHCVQKNRPAVFCTKCWQIHRHTAIIIGKQCGKSNVKLVIQTSFVHITQLLWYINLQNIMLVLSPHRNTNWIYARRQPRLQIRQI